MILRQPRTYITVGEFIGRWLASCAPKAEDCGTSLEPPFLAVDVYNVVTFFAGNGNFISGSGTYDPANILADPDAQRITDTYRWFPSYATVIWIEEGQAIENDALAGGTQYIDAVNQLEADTIQAVAALAPYGFSYKGRFDYRSNSSIARISRDILDHWNLS
jgi:hypothetical protein